MKENKQITIQIKSIFGKVLFEYTKLNNILKDTLEVAVNSNADLRYTDLSNADLSNADLSNADLSNANLRYADLSNADLRYANLSNADLRYANLSNAYLDEKEKLRKGVIIDKPVRVFKKCIKNNIVELELLKGSIVFSINNKKCRTNKAKVISINGKCEKGLKCRSSYNYKFIYEVGKTLEVKDFDLMYNVECSSGIHFFWTKEEAEDYVL